MLKRAIPGIHSTDLGKQKGEAKTGLALSELKTG
tara:strand:- start:685 stop:786 length:102 start_codon:yes stop_codon:yes gene_type:complete